MRVSLSKDSGRPGKGKYSLKLFLFGSQPLRGTPFFATGRSDFVMGSYVLARS